MIRTTTISILAAGLLAGTTVGVTAQDEGSERVTTSFTGRFTSQEDVISHGTSTGPGDDGLELTTGIVVLGSMVSSDPRLTGTVTSALTYLIDTNAINDDHAANILATGTYELTNDEGSWLGEATNFGNIDLGVNYQTIIFEGRGGYEGLTAYAVVDWWGFAGEYVGTVFPAPMPEIPEPYAVE
jgi:hypothetical protein